MMRMAALTLVLAACGSATPARCPPTPAAAAPKATVTPAPVEPAMADPLTIRVFASPLPCVILPSGKNRSLTDLAIPGLAVTDQADQGVSLVSLAVALRSGDETLVTQTIEGDALRRETQRGGWIARSALWRDLFFRPGFVTDPAAISDAVDLHPRASAFVTGLHLAATSPQPAGFADVVVTWRAASGKTGTSKASFPLVSPRTKTKYLFPLRGAWQVQSNWDATNGHRRSSFTQFALDFAKVDGRGLLYRRTPPRSNADVVGFGETVRAPRDGEVVDLHDGVVDNAPDKRPSDDDMLKQLPAAGLLATIGGNYIVLRHEDGEYSFMCHLALHSIRVRVGQKVRRGEPIAQVGNGGNTDIAHLHFQVMDKPDLSGVPLLVEFDGLRDVIDKPLTFVDDNKTVVHSAD